MRGIKRKQENEHSIILSAIQSITNIIMMPVHGTEAISMISANYLDRDMNSRARIFAKLDAIGSAKPRQASPLVSKPIQAFNAVILSWPKKVLLE